MRKRVPAEYAAIEERAEVNKSLRTRDYKEAMARFAVAWHALNSEWAALNALKHDDESPDAFDSSIALLKNIGVPYRSLDDLVSGPIQDLLDRIAILGQSKPDSAQVPGVLGTLKFPRVLVSEMPAIVEKNNEANLAAKNDRQLRAWKNKYSQAAKSFCSIVGDKPVLEITEQDALAVRKYWKGRRDKGEITTNHAVKKMRFMRQSVDAYFERFDVPPSQRRNPFSGLKIEKMLGGIGEESRKLALPMPWVRKVIIDQVGLGGLNVEARDIATIAAASGSRQTEVIDLPPSDIHLNHDIPHFQIQVVTDERFKRQIKNVASKRPVILLGAALEAMCRHPEGFPRYRGTDSYSATVNSHLRDKDLFPKLPKGETGKYTIGCTRHTFEDQMSNAKMSNEERAYLMGHSIGKIRGRPVYGSEPDLRVRAIYQEMVSFPTENWKPRSISALRQELDRMAEELGFRVE